MLLIQPQHYFYMTWWTWSLCSSLQGEYR